VLDGTLSKAHEKRVTGSRSTRMALLLILVAARARAEGAGTNPAPLNLDPSQVVRASAPDLKPASVRGSEASGDDAVLRAYREIERLKLVQKSDGSFAYTGRGFSARIDARGGLRITDKFRRTSFVLEPKPIDEVNWVTYFLRTTFDLLARLDKAFGNDPFRSERRDFLEQTRDLRMALLERNAEQALERALHTIWAAANSSPQQRRQETFALWAECSEDEYGERVRRRIEEYVRERCPIGSACEYTPDDLSRLNAQRSGKRAFAPYPPDAGAP
jgi:hypothetical protein